LTRGTQEYASSSYIYYGTRESMSRISFSRFKRAMLLKKLEEKKEQETETN
jgi:hypothetical protein